MSCETRVGDGRGSAGRGEGRGWFHARRRRPGAPRGRSGRRAARAAARDRHVLREVGDLPRCGSPCTPARCSTPSTTTAGRRRTRPGGSITTIGSSTPAPDAWTRLPWFRRTIEDARLEDVVIAVIGSSPTSPRTGRLRSGWCSSTAATRSTSPSPTTKDGRASSSPAGCSSFHDVFEDPADGGQAPFEVWKHAVASGDFEPASTTGSLRVLRRR